MAECFCGCGLEVPFGRRRAANALGEQFDEHLRVFRGALERSANATGRESLVELVAGGEALRASLRGIVHARPAER